MAIIELLSSHTTHAQLDTSNGEVKFTQKQGLGKPDLVMRLPSHNLLNMSQMVVDMVLHLMRAGTDRQQAPPLSPQEYREKYPKGETQ